MGNKSEMKERETERRIKREREREHWGEMVLAWVRNGH